MVFGARRQLSERVYFDRRTEQTASRTPASSNSKATGEQRLCNVYATTEGRSLRAKRRFRSFRLTPLDGSAAQQGMACFAQIDGRYAMIAGRTESLYRPLRRFVYVERQSRHPSTRVSVGFVQIGSCGSPIEMRGAGCCDARVGGAKVFIGAVLLDKDTRQVLARSRQPGSSEPSEREGCAQRRLHLRRNAPPTSHCPTRCRTRSRISRR